MEDKPLVWLKGQIETPPMSVVARLEVGLHLRRLQRGETIGMPHSRPMPSVGRRCHELRVCDPHGNWRILYRTDPDAVLKLDVFAKKTESTPTHVIQAARRRIAAYDAM